MRLRLIAEDNVNIDLNEIVYKDVNSFDLAQVTNK